MPFNVDKLESGKRRMRKHDFFSSVSVDFQCTCLKCFVCCLPTVSLSLYTCWLFLFDLKKLFSFLINVCLFY